MRMIGIGLMGFLLAGVALLLSTMNILEKGQRYVSELTDGPQLVFENRLAVSASDQHRATVYRSNPNHPVILSGLPAYQGVAFTFPLDARPTSGYLQIDATSQVLTGVEGVLRISIDNIRRGEVLLRPGEVGHSLQIPLSPTDFARDELVVSFSLQGEGPNTQCSSDEGLEAVVEIETTSAVFLTLDRPLVSPRDLVSSWGQLVRVGWPEWLAPEERLRRLALAARFKKLGVDALFVSQQDQRSLSTVEMRDAIMYYENASPKSAPVAWPMPIAKTGANYGVRRFHHSTQWRQRVDLRQNEGMYLPEAFDLQLALGFLTDSNRWSVVTTLNGRLLSQETLDVGQREYASKIALPKEMFSAINLIEVQATATYTRDDVCDEGPELVAEMLPSSVLIKGDTAFDDEISSLRATLETLGTLTLGSLEPLTEVDAAIAADLLAEIVASGPVLKPSSGLAQVVVVSPSIAGITLPETEPVWIVYRERETRRIVVEPFESGTQMAETSVALIVAPAGVLLGGSST